MTAPPGGPVYDDELYDELEPHRAWTAADRVRLVAWVLVFGLLLGVLMLAPIGDAALQRAADAAGSDGASARTTYWVAIGLATILGAAAGAAGAATKQRWAIVPPLVGAVACALALPIALGLV